jgi:peptidoglycan/LPS O-acetylase OafA/YrhL
MHYSPARILWAGSEAVVVFYVLSGFVLALPFARNHGQPWRYFYPRRLLRLYLPAAASLVFAYLTTLAVSRSVLPDAGHWLNEHAEKPNGLLQVLLGSSLMAVWGGLNTSLWSLRWEVIFSLLLPLFLLFAVRFKRLLWFKAAVVVAFCIFWRLAGVFYPDLVYISVFALGVLMAYNTDLLREWAKRVPLWGWIGALVLAAVLITNSALIAAFDPYSPLRAGWIGPAAAGSALLVFVVAHWAPAVRLFSSGAIRWLGMISFSLYLTQEPVVVALGVLTRGQAPLWLQLPVVAAATLLIGWLFYLGVERPSHRVARRFGLARQQREEAEQSRTSMPDAAPQPQGALPGAS